MTANALSATSKTLAHSNSALAYLQYAQPVLPSNYLIADTDDQTYTLMSVNDKSRHDQQRANREANVLEMIDYAHNNHKLLHKVDDHA